jgi:hypothetical protein
LGTISKCSNYGCEVQSLGILRSLLLELSRYLLSTKTIASILIPTSIERSS